MKTKQVVSGDGVDAGLAGWLKRLPRSRGSLAMTRGMVAAIFGAGLLWTLVVFAQGRNEQKATDFVDNSGVKVGEVDEAGVLDFSGMEATAVGQVTRAAGSFTTLSAGEAIATSSVVNVGGSISLGEQAEADADTAGYGQVWVDLATPNLLMFTNDGGTDFVISGGGGAISGGGTTNLIPKWTAGNVLGDSILAEISSEIGINTTIPETLLDVRGPATGILTLSTSDTTITSAVALGQINFQAPEESQGGDAILVGASIWAVPGVAYTPTVNDTDLVFATALSETATEKMRLTADGKLGIGTDPKGEGFLYVQESIVTGQGPPAGWTPQVYIENNGDTSINIISASVDEGAIWFSDDSSPGGQGKIGYDHNQDRLEFGTVDGSERLHIGSDVGIGTAADFSTAAPVEMLDIRSDSTDAFGGTLALTTANPFILAGKLLGQINFEAPLAVGGGDANLTAASIWAEAGDTFSATVNDTDLVFAAAISEVAEEQMRLDSTGRLTLQRALDIVESGLPFGSRPAAGQVWVRNSSPNELMYTDDAGSTFLVSGASAGDITGSGTANAIAKFTATNAIADSILNELSGTIGVNTSSPTSILDVRDAGGGVGTFSTSETIVVDATKLGQIDFSAPEEASGGDALLPGASIWAEADATFSAAVNNTDLVFATGESEAATEKMRLTSSGQVLIGTGGPPDKTLELRNASPILRLRDTGGSASATTAFIEFGGTDAAAFTRTGWVGDASSGSSDISLRAELGSLDLGDSTSGTVLVLSGGDATFSDGLQVNGTAGIGIARTDGTLHVHTASCGAQSAPAAADDIVVENNASGGMTILTPDAASSEIVFGSPSRQTGAFIDWRFGNLAWQIGTATASAKVEIFSGNGVLAMTLNSTQDIEIPSGGLAVTLGDLAIAGSSEFTGNVKIGAPGAAVQMLHLKRADVATMQMKLENTDTDVGYGAGSGLARIFVAGVEKQRMNAIQTVFNFGQADTDWNTRGDTDANLIFANAGADTVGVGVNVPGGKLHVDQLSAAKAIPVLVLDQGDIDDSFTNYIGTSAADGTRSISSDTTEDSTKFGAIRIEINGVTKWIRVYDNES